MRKNIRRKQGFTLVEIMIAVGIVILISALSIYSLLWAKINANETAAINNLRALQEAFASYREVNPSYPEDLGILASDTPPYIDNTLAQGSKQGYDFEIVDVTANTFRLAAVPRSPGVTGSRSFFIDQGGEITEAIGIDVDPTGVTNGETPGATVY